MAFSRFCSLEYSFFNMLMMLLIAGAGGIGALLRVFILSICARAHTVLPLGTLTVNILACLACGMVLELQLDKSAAAVLIVGVVGGLGTLSSICSDTINLCTVRQFKVLALYLMLTAVCGLGAGLAGLSLGEALCRM